MRPAEIQRGLQVTIDVDQHPTCQDAVGYFSAASYSFRYSSGRGVHTSRFLTP